MLNPRILFIVLLLHVASAQRAVVSLGKRIRQWGTSRTTSRNDEYIMEGRIVSITHVFGASIVLIVVALVMSFQDENEEDDYEVLIKDDHVEAMDEIDLAFEGIQLEIMSRKGNKIILDGSIRGRARPGRMLAIMGPSGAGKSSLLHALAGRIKYNRNLRLQGKRYVNGLLVSGDSMIPAAFIEQDVNFFPHMTVRETLGFRVDLKLGSKLSKKARTRMVNDLMSQLGLTKVADTIVGNSKIRGISGGERKRLSIAVEMISSPSLIFLDEPTSGLDSTAATALVETLRDLADAGKTIIAVIHQPSQHVFAKFDDLLLVSEGKLMYFGDQAHVRSYMEVHGCQPESAEMGTAEHVLDCITRMPIERESEKDVDDRMAHLAEKAVSSKVSLGLVPANKEQVKHYSAGHRHHGPRANVFIQFRLLLQRALKEVARGKGALLIKTIQQITLGFIYGGIYSLGSDQSSIQDRFGLLSLIAIGSSNMAVAQSIRSFPKEKAIVSGEIASRMYRTLPYFIAKAISEIPLVAFFNGVFGAIVYHLTGLSRTAGKFRNFLTLLFTHGLISESTGLVIGAWSKNSDVALALFPAVLVLNIIFDGKNISEENTPKLLRWIPKVGLIRWGFEGLCVNEFDGLEFEAKGPRRGPVAKTGADALARFGLGNNSVGDVIRAQIIITGASWVLSYVGLTLTKERFMVMKEANGKGSNNQYE